MRGFVDIAIGQLYWPGPVWVSLSCAEFEHWADGGCEAYSAGRAEGGRGDATYAGGRSRSKSLPSEHSQVRGNGAGC